MILNIENIGSTILKKLVDTATVNEIKTKEIQELITNMFETMFHHQGVGIAAPQVGVNKQIVCIGGYEKNLRYPDKPPVARTVLINPIYEPCSNDIINDVEGCLSVPGKRGTVARFKKIKYNASDENGNFVTGIAEDFFARIIQHEVDHLNGILFIEKAIDIFEI